jgi:hypothetical protein
MTHVEQLGLYLETEKAPQDVHHGAVLALFALWLDEQEEDRPRIFSGDTSAPLWDAINSAHNVDGLREALYLIGCYLQRFESQTEHFR